MEYLEKSFLISEPSQWWLKSLAIFMAIMTFAMALQVASGVLTPILLDQVPREFDELEKYPENGSQEEIDNWSASNQFWIETIEYLDEIKNIMNYYVLYGLILFFLGLITVPILWNGQRHLGLRLTLSWFVIYVIGQINLVLMLYFGPGFYPDYDFGLDSGNSRILDLIETATVIYSIGQILLCNTLLLAVILFISSKAKRKTTFDIPSAFHNKDNEK
ncbi:MAG: hypothetical protein ACKVI6_03490 [Candidatus Poseidoniales archaeon]|jgi:hypothetical protein|tara:strand:+ start:234 stop:887 length:654 start_codon:yes stop_codon:yes gene_type:complete